MDVTHYAPQQDRHRPGTEGIINLSHPHLSIDLEFLLGKNGCRLSKENSIQSRKKTKRRIALLRRVYYPRGS